MAVAIRPEKISAAELEDRMRALPIPVIPRDFNAMVVLDVRTIDKESVKLIVEQFKELDVMEETSKAARR